ncbi:MAG TPA: aminoglycoside phosphotransferase family protein [Mycobacteriales bacterium]|nr:aminoglycoside phosphotransferase family protein [Mycobacteriales bacterium]
MTSDQERATAVIAEHCGRPVAVWPYFTWARSVVVGARLADGSEVVLKANGDRSVRAEACALRLAADAGVPVPPVLGEGIAEDLPGRHWMLLGKAHGRPWTLPTPNSRASARTQEDLGRVFARLHGCALPGFGQLTEDGTGGYERWSEWLTDSLAGPLHFLRSGGYFEPALTSRIERLFTDLAPLLDRRPGVLIHGDLGGMEIFVNTRNQVVGIVDFGNAVVGDPLYDFAHFVRGGPADDPRSAAILPGVRRSYIAHGGENPPNWDQLFAVYDVFNTVRNAEWAVREDVPWVTGLRDKAVQLLDRL